MGKNNKEFKRSPGHVPSEMEGFLFSEEFVSAHRLEAERCLRILDLPKGSMILDIGCGTATATLGLLKEGNNIIGLDISKEMLGWAKRRIRENKVEIDLVMSDMLNLPFKEGTFDGVTCMDVTFGFFGSDGDFLQVNEMSRVLKVGGRLFVETFDKGYGIQNPGSKEAGQYWGTYDRESDRFSGLNLYSLEQWKQMLDLAGMRLLKALSADVYDLQYFNYNPGHKILIILALK